MNIEALKEQARRHEQREEWSKALDQYLKAIDKLGEEEDPDIALYNRVGDLQVRLGDIDAAMVHYEKAIDFYVEAELANNAIALCRKITRSAPNRASAYLRMGQIRARQGFLVDARQNFLTYAEIQQAKGGMDEALRALAEFVSLAPNDTETRLFLADLLAGAGKIDDAIKHFRAAYGKLLAAGDRDAAARVATKLQEMDPDRPLPSTAEEPEVRARVTSGELLGFESTSLGAEEDSAEVEDEASSEDEGAAADLAFEDFSFDDPAEEEEEEPPQAQSPVEVADDFEGFSLDGLPEEDQASEDDIPDDATPLPTWDMDEPDDPGEEEDEELEDDLTPLPTFDLGTEEDSAPDEDPFVELPPLELDSDDEGEEADSTPFLTLEEVPDDDEDPPSHDHLADRGDISGAIEALQALIDADPDHLALRQRMVEYAYRTDDRGILVHAFQELAGTLRRGGEEVKAQAVYRQVLNLDSRNREALEAVGAASISPPAGAPAKVAGGEAAPPSEGFVDLGSLVLDRETEGSTRWVVAAQAPSGDEQADFAQMLQQFKQKVSENLSADDAKSHYDLGSAYKDMGLLDEAVGEFQQALRAQSGHLPTFEMLGQCFLEKGDHEVAIRTLERAREAPWQIEDDLLGIYYYLGMAYEETGNSERAREFYEKVFSLDINFKDVTERLRALR